MLFRYYLTSAATLALLARARLTAIGVKQKVFALEPVCLRIAGAISPASDVYYPGHSLYKKDIEHWASSSTQFAKCTVEPGTVFDLGIILEILGSTRTPFAVKGGGHASNPGFSSTTGVLIAMYRFSEVTYNTASRTVVIGAGLVWDDVYAALASHGVNVVGGRVTGVGVAGFILGGGFSWKTNQYGLTIDTVTAYELVKPNGAVVSVTESSDSSLFFALKGGFNNFGIVTRFTLKAFPQGQVWGGFITYTSPHIPEVSTATANFSARVTDPKASIITTFNFFLGQPGVSLLLFYDGPTPPSGIFEDFLSIPHFTKNVKTRDFLSLVQSSPANATHGQRGIFNTVSLLELTPRIMKAVINQTIFWGPRLSLRSGTFITHTVQPFLPSAFSQSAPPSAYPPSRSQTLMPVDIYYAWFLELFDVDFHNAARQSAAHISDVASAEGQRITEAPVYPNYAIFDTPLVNMYGSNIATLRSIKLAIDPTNIMGLAGGFKF